MKLPFSLGKKKEKLEYFLALLLRDEKVNAVIFEEIEGKIKIVGEQEENFSDSIESVSPEELLEIIDKAISKAETNLPEGTETQKTIFGLKDEWVENSQIKKDYLAKLKKISDELGLLPIGFLVITEAIAHLLAKEEGAPVSAILVELGNKKIGLSLIRAGRIVETKRTQIEDSIAKTTDKLLFHFTTYEVLPSRIIIFDGEDQRDLSQEFISHSWSKTLPFLHVPQIATLQKRFDARAMLFGAATQMGFELLDKDPKPVTHIVHEPKNEPQTKDQEVKKDEVEEKVATPKTEEAAGDFGFVKESDIRSSAKVDETKEEINEQKVDHIVLPSKTVPVTEKMKAFLAFLPSIGILKNLLNIFSTVRLPTNLFRVNPKKIFFIPPLVILGLIILLLVYVFGVYANVILTVNSNTVNKTQALTFSLQDSTNISNNIIKVDTLSVTKTVSLSTPATGTKEVGESAKGSVTVYNGGDEKTLLKGSIINAPNGLEFTLDNDVTVSSASGDITSGTIKVGTKTVSITAKNIGKESNLPSGTKFTVNLHPSLVAKNDSALSGGSKKEITVVAKNDLDKLTNDAIKNTKDAKDTLSQKIPQGTKMLPDFVKTDLSQKEFDKKLGDEAGSVNLKSTITYQAFVYSIEDLNNLGKSAFKENNTPLSSKGINYEIKDLKQKKDTEISGSVAMKAYLLPKIDKESVVQKISGKSFQEAENIILKLPQASVVEFKLKPQLPFLPKTLPRIPSHITFTIES